MAYSTGVINQIDPGNSHIREYRDRYDREHVYTTLSDELRVNPFIGFNDSGLDSFRETLKMPLDSEYKRWRAMMTVH